MRITRTEIEKIDLDPLRHFVATPSEFFGEKQHYKLLAYLSTLVPEGKEIVDIGTHLGDSAVALSLGGRDVTTFDIVKKIGRELPGNVRQVTANLFDQATRVQFRGLLLDSALILIDIDPHEGTREYELVTWLYENDYQGVIVLDDIWYFKGMRNNLWYRIEAAYRTDVTAVGHWSGTGLVSFPSRVEFEDDSDTSNWTLVTGYFDLTKAPDANDAIRARSATHYIDEHAASTLSLDKSLVVFCEPELASIIWSMRPQWLHDRTRVITMSFEEFPLTKFRDRIIENRGGSSGCSTDPRNTASYYLFCMARYAMLKRAIRDNPFGSTHFAWINICIERMGFNNLVHLDEALSLYRNRFSTCFIDYVSKDRVQALEDYFGAGGCRGCRAGCTMCSGFFTGDAGNMLMVCELLEKEFLRCLELGYGHADEQLFPIVYHEHPELFDWYLGDYQQMITNYAGVYENPEAPIRNLVAHSAASGDMAVARRAATILLESYGSKKCRLSMKDYMFLRELSETTK